MTNALRTLALCFGLVGLSCGPIDAAIDCNSICNRYKTCFDGNYDVAACADRCRGSSSTDSDYRRKADTCNACITDRACASATFSCGTDCTAVVP